MGALLATAATICALSLVLGQAVMRAAGARTWSWLSPAVGFAVLMVVCSVGVRLPGHAATARVLVAIAAFTAVAVVVRPLGRPRWNDAGGWTAGLLLLGVLLPFAANARVGILGVLDNADLSAHLVLADAMRIGVTPVDVGYAQVGYPTGPHAIAAVMTALRTDVETSFTALLVSIPVLTGLTALAFLRDVPMPWRAGAAAVVGLPYLAAAYLVQSSFKEPIQALLLLGFLATLREATREGMSRSRSALPLLSLAVAMVATYSFLGLAWPAAILACWGLLEVLTRRRLPSRTTLRRIARPALIGVGVLLLAALLADVGDFLEELLLIGGETRGGNILYPIAAYQLLGISPADDFRLGAESSLAPLLAAAAAAMIGYSLLWWVRRGDLAAPAAVLGCLLLYAQARGFATPYYDAKALVIAAPLVTLLVTRTLTAGLPGLRMRSPGGLAPAGAARLVVAAGFLVLAALSSSLVLRAARVEPGEHATELAEIRPLVQGAPTLFLGQDDYAFWRLRGARLSAVRSYIGISQVPFSLRPVKPVSGFMPLSLGKPLDFDSLDHANLDRFRYVITTRTPFASAAPANWRPVRRTRSYLVWRRDGPTPDRGLLAEGAHPGALLDCRTAAGRRLSGRAGWAGARAEPVVGAVHDWKVASRAATVGALGHAEVPAGRIARHSLTLPPGTWDLSVQYISERPLVVEGPGLRSELPPSTARGGPFWGAGRVNVRGGETTVSITSAPAPTLARRRLVSLGSVAATRAEDEQAVVPLSQACGRYLDWYVLA